MKTENQEILEEISKYSCNDTHKAIASRVFIALRNGNLSNEFSLL